MHRLSAQLEITDSSSRGAHMAAADLVLYFFIIIIIIDCFRCERGVGSCCVLKSGRKSGGSVKTVAL